MLWILTSVAFSLIIASIVAIGFAALATWLVERVGRWTLAPLWLVASLSTSTLLLLRVQHVQMASGMTHAYGMPFPAFGYFLGLWAFGLGAVSLFVWQRVRRGTTGFTAEVALRSAGGFVAGCLLFLAGVAIKDFIDLLTVP